MRECPDIRLDFLELLTGRLKPRAEASVLEHVAACPACAAELHALRRAWEALPASIDAKAPSSVRKRVFAYARRSRSAPGGVFGPLWATVRDELAAPVALGTAAALLIMVGTHLRGTMAPLGHAGVATLSLSLSAALAIVAGGIMRSSTPRAVRAVLLGAVGALGGYVALSLVLPLPATFEICRLALFGDDPMSLGQVCVVYLGVAAAYAGIPLGVAAYVWSGAGARWATGIAEAVLFTILAAPVLVLQAGLEETMITGTVALGLLLGSLAGGAAGTWARAHRLVRSRA
ncbi:MAG: hypothetical protein HY704_06670 [Gemmatimonadetes bacterium]|nr:hypothetical protein [Gemmatimonadota bacterium]